MRLLILGGSGFVSRFVVKEAIAQGHEVFCITRGLRETVPGSTVLTADRNDPAALEIAIQSVGGTFDAALDCICFNAAQAEADLNIIGKYTDRLVVISTDSVYFNDHRVPRDENGTYITDSSYGGQKRQMECVFEKSVSPRLRWTLFRPPHLFGPGSELGCFPLHTRQKDLLTVIREEQDITLVGGGTFRIQPLYAGDLAKAMLACIQNPAAYNEILCICGPDNIQNREYFTILGEILGHPVHFRETDTDQYMAEHSEGYQYTCDRCYDLSKLRKAGIPVPSVSLRQGLQEQVDYLVSQGR